MSTSLETNQIFMESLTTLREACSAYYANYKKQQKMIEDEINAYVTEQNTLEGWARWYYMPRFNYCSRIHTTTEINEIIATKRAFETECANVVLSDASPTEDMIKYHMHVNKSMINERLAFLKTVIAQKRAELIQLSANLDLNVPLYFRK